MTIFSSPGSSPAGKRILAAGTAYQNRKVRMIQTAHRQRGMLREVHEAAIKAREAQMASAAQASAERFYDDPVTMVRPTMAQIVAEVSQRTGVSVNLIMSHRREKRLVLVRQECFWLCREKTTHSYPTIARFFHRDHCTIMSGCRAHEQRMVREVPFDG